MDGRGIFHQLARSMRRATSAQWLECQGSGGGGYERVRGGMSRARGGGGGGEG